MHSNQRSKAQPGGYTLLELVVASASAAVLVGGLAASLYISSKSLEATTGSLAETRIANKALDALTRDLQSALTLSELTSTSVTMTVPDRSGDSVPETIRYHWASVGAPLIRTYNGTSADIATDVQSFSLKWLSRLIEGVSSAPVILFVSSQPPDGTGGLATPSTVEQARITLMEGWGYNVTVISEQASQAEIDDAITDATVVYVPGVCNPTTVGSKVTNTTIGVVTESFAHALELGFYSSVSAFSSGSTTIQLTDSSHFITSGLTLGQLTVATTSQAMKWTSSPASADASKLADVHTLVPHPTLMALDIDDMRAGGGVIPGRRVQLPWGESSFDATALTADGQTIMQRSLQWAAGSNEGSTRPLLLLVVDETSPTTAETGRQTLLESWGYDVTLATANQPQSVYDTYPGTYDVVYVPASVTYTDVGSKLKLLSIGVVNEVPDLSYYFGFTSNTDNFFATETNITDNTHEITRPFSTGNLKVSDIPLFGSLRSFTGSIGPGLQTLSTKTSSSDRMIMTLDAGDGLLFGGTTPDRRVMLPWGTHSTHNVYDDLTAEGRTILHRAIDWAAWSTETSGNPDSLCFSTNADVSSGGHSPGIDTWQSAEALSLSGTTTLEPGGTAGSIASMFNLNLHASNDSSIDALHIIKQGVTVGNMALQPGDLLISTASGETVGGINIADEDVLLFRPDTVGDYSTGTWSLLLDSSDFGLSDDIQALTVVEQAQTIGGIALSAGDLLVANNSEDVLRLQVTSTGTNSAATNSMFIDASDLGVSTTNRTVGIHVVNEEILLGDTLVSPGKILWTLTNSEIGGIGVLHDDVLPHDVVALYLSTAGNTCAGTPSMLLDGSQIGLDTASEEIHSLAVEPAVFGEPISATGVVYQEFTEASRSSNGSNVTIDLPAGTANGDLLVAAVATDGNTGSSLSPPAGWNQILVDADSQDKVTLGVWWKEAGSSEPATYDFTWTGSEKAYGMVMRFTGHKPTAPIHAQADAESGSDTSSPPSPGVTTTVDNCLILRLGGFDDDDVTNGDAGVSGHTTITAGESNNGTSSCSGAAAYVMQGTAGATGAANFSLGGAEEYRTVTIAIEPNP